MGGRLWYVALVAAVLLLTTRSALAQCPTRLSQAVISQVQTPGIAASAASTDLVEAAHQMGGVLPALDAARAQSQEFRRGLMESEAALRQTTPASFGYLEHREAWQALSDGLLINEEAVRVLQCWVASGQEPGGEAGFDGADGRGRPIGSRSPSAPPRQTFDQGLSQRGGAVLSELNRQAFVKAFDLNEVTEDLNLLVEAILGEGPVRSASQSAPDPLPSRVALPVTPATAGGL